MKRKNLIFVSALLASQSMMAQTPYMNENYMPTDLIGSARYVGMGGALGALGADLSTASSNPAALGLYRRSDAALSFSVLTQQEKPETILAETLLLPEQVLLLAVTELPTLVR